MSRYLDFAHCVTALVNVPAAKAFAFLADPLSLGTWSLGCMRTRALARSEGRMKVVSDRLNCRARACILASSRVCARSNTHSGLPLRTVRPCVKTLTRR